MVGSPQASPYPNTSIPKNTMGIMESVVTGRSTCVYTARTPDARAMME